MNLLNAVQSNWFPKLFREADFARIEAGCRLVQKKAPEKADKDFLLQNVADAEVVLTSWDTARFDSDVIAAARNLKLVIHVAGTLKPVVSEAFWQKGVRGVSLASAISYGVAEHCLGCMLTAPKRLFWAVEGTRRGEWKEGLRVFEGPFDLYSQKIGIIGVGHVGRHLIQLLKSFTCEVYVYDPYLTEEAAAALGVTKVAALEDIFSQCKVVTLCAAGNVHTRGMIKQEHFAMLPAGAVFINVSRGGIFDEKVLVAELRKGRFVACLDVTDIEPPAVDHPYRSLPNILFTPHVAGGAAENLLRIGAFAADEVERYVQGSPLKYEITEEMMQRIA